MTIENLIFSQFTTKRPLKVKFFVLQKDLQLQFKCIIGRKTHLNLGLDSINLEKQTQWSNNLIHIVLKTDWKQNKHFFRPSMNIKMTNKRVYCWKVTIKYKTFLRSHLYRVNWLKTNNHYHKRTLENMKHFFQANQEYRRVNIVDVNLRKTSSLFIQNYVKFHTQLLLYSKKKLISWCNREFFTQSRQLMECTYICNSDGQIRIVSDFCRLNIRLICTLFPQPNIRVQHDSILAHVEYFTTIFILQNYYICTIILPWWEVLL